jgi:hypothetical protein
MRPPVVFKNKMSTKSAFPNILMGSSGVIGFVQNEWRGERREGEKRHETKPARKTLIS